jgi:hypothetical protein
MFAFAPISHADDVVDVSRLRKDEIKQESLTPQQMADVAKIQKALAEVGRPQFKFAPASVNW